MIDIQMQVNTQNMQVISNVSISLIHAKVDKNKPVLIAGDPEKENMVKVEKMGGLLYHTNQIIASEQMAENLGVNPMKLLIRGQSHAPRKT